MHKLIYIILVALGIMGVGLINEESREIDVGIPLQEMFGSCFIYSSMQ